MDKRTLIRCACLAAVMAAAVPQALAQQAVRIVVGGPPGGLFDIVIRHAQERLERGLGGPVVVDNKPGAGGTLAVETLKLAKPDGLTIGMINVSSAANESIVKGKSFNLLTDMEPVGLYAYPANVLIVNPAVNAKTVPELVDALKRAAATNYSSGGVGSPGHLSGELFKSRTGVAMTHVPYKGAPPAVLAVVTGEVSLMFATAPSALGQIGPGKVRALAVTTSERLRQLPDVPTVAEAGLADFNVSDWVGVIVPKGTPVDVRDRLHATLSAVFAEPDVQERLRGSAILPAAKPLNPAEFAAFLKSEVDKWAKVVAEAKISQN